MRKTAIMQAIDEIKESVSQEEQIINEPKGYHPDAVIECRIIVNCANNHIEILNKLLETERQQIVEAIDSVQIVSRRYYLSHIGGYGDHLLGKEINDPDINNDGRDYFGLNTTGEQYYSTTFQK